MVRRLPRLGVVGLFELTLNSRRFLQPDQPPLWLDHRILLTAIVP